VGKRFVKKRSVDALADVVPNPRHPMFTSVRAFEKLAKTGIQQLVLDASSCPTVNM
jgi:hypothetical protein